MLDNAKIEELKAKHGELVAVQSKDDATVVFRAPTRAEYDRWFDKRDGSQSAAARELCQSALVYPDRDGMIAMLDRYPALLLCRGGMLDAVTGLAGMGEDSRATTKKL